MTRSSPFYRSLFLAAVAFWYAAGQAGAAVPAISLDDIPKYAPDRVVVAFRPGTPAETVRSVHAQNGGNVLKTFDSIGADLVSVAAGSVAQKIALYSRNPNVLYAEPNFYRIMIIPDEGSEPPPPSGIGDYWKEQWGLHNTGTIYSYTVDPFTGELTAVAVPVEANADIDAPPGWDVFLEDCPDAAACPPSRIAILDSGVDCLHVDLDCDLDVNVAADYVSGVPDGDLLGHGTHVAGIAAAVNNNGVGIAGVSWNSLIGSFKVCYGYPVGFPVVGLCESAAIIDALGQAAAAGYDVVNMSFGGPDASAAEAAALNAAFSDGVVLVSSAGNEYAREGCSFPSTHASVISVAATDYHDNLSPFSNFGDCASVLAPGSNVFSTYPGAACGVAADDPEGCYSWLEGTSMASPAVAGLAAMIRTMAPASTSQQVRELIEQHADIDGARGQNMQAWSQFGRINVATTLSAVTTAPPPPPPPATDDMYVWSISMYTRGPNLNIDVAVKWDSDGDGEAEASDAPAAGAVLSVELCPTSGGACNFQTTAAPTNANGEASYKARQAAGNYRFQVTNITHAQYVWQPALDQGNPAFYP